MKHARDALNEIKWRDGLGLEDAMVYYLDHQQPELSIIEGKNIQSWDKSFIYTTTGSVIPFHRVEKIMHKSEVLYSRK
jgi:uncharacterized protein (UPF0248 family)